MPILARRLRAAAAALPLVGLLSCRGPEQGMAWPPLLSRAPAPAVTPAAWPQPGDDGAIEEPAAGTAVPAEDLGPVATPTQPGIVAAVLIGASAHFEFYASDGIGPLPAAKLAAAAERIYTDVSGRLGAGLSTPIKVTFSPPAVGTCALRGLAQTDRAELTLFATPATDRAQLWGVLAHEVAHSIHLNGMARGTQDDRLLVEGLATWAAGNYWLVWKQSPSFDAAAAGYLHSGGYVPLDEAFATLGSDLYALSPAGDCLRDVAYAEAASFLGLLIERSGLNTLLTLAPAHGAQVEDGQAPQPAALDYQAAYGEPFAQLTEEWLARLRALPAGGSSACGVDAGGVVTQHAGLGL
jgi:hypothetical protein